uniref:Apolipoprotein A-I n=1 Tax=Lygus hesperus TaxID=30085 RepID=A0A0A9YJA2_LYGHE
MYAALEAMADIRSLEVLRERFDKMSNQIEKFYETLEEMKIEIRNMEPELKTEWKENFKVHRQEYIGIVNQLKDIKQRIDRESLLQSSVQPGKGGPNNSNNNQDNEDPTNEAMMEEGRSLMGSNKTALQQTLQTVQGARDLGTMSIDMLLEQQRQLEQVEDNLTTIDST